MQCDYILKSLPPIYIYIDFPFALTAIPGMHQASSTNNNNANSAATKSIHSNKNTNTNSNSNSKDGGSSSKLARIEAKLEADVERVVQEVDGELW